MPIGSLAALTLWAAVIMELANDMCINRRLLLQFIKKNKNKKSKIKNYNK